MANGLQSTFQTVFRARSPLTNQFDGRNGATTEAAVATVSPRSDLQRATKVGRDGTHIADGGGRYVTKGLEHEKQDRTNRRPTQHIPKSVWIG